MPTAPGSVTSEWSFAMTFNLVCAVDLCPSGQFFCESESGRCVNEDFRCDGIPDCIQLATDGSANIIPADELNCPNPGRVAMAGRVVMASPGWVAMAGRVVMASPGWVVMAA